jgi:hypothetical protein
MKKSILLVKVFVLCMLVAPVAVFVYSSTASALVCPDGRTVPDAEANKCDEAPARPEAPNGSAFTDIRVQPIEFSKASNLHICGNDGIQGNATETSENENEVRVAFDFGCRGDQYTGNLNPVIDIMFAIFRFLSAGVGLVVIGSIIVAGIQYATSAGNPQATQAAIKRISSSVVALLLFMFMFTLANFLVPGGLFVR